MPRAATPLVEAWFPKRGNALQSRSSAERRAGFDDAASAIERNKRITAEYARLFKADPQRFLWPGLAAMASDEVGKTLVQLRDFATPALRGDDRELDPITAPIAAYVGELLAKGNRAVYDDIAWQFIAYHEAEMRRPGLGLELMSRLAKEKDETGRPMLSGKALAAWQQIAQGGKGILEGTIGITRHEQEDILQPVVFDDPIVKSAGEFLSKENEPLFHGAPRFEGPNIADFGKRWKWISEHLIPGWAKYQTYRDSRTGVDNTDWKSNNNLVKNAMDRLIANVPKK